MMGFFYGQKQEAYQEAVNNKTDLVKAVIRIQ